MGERFACEFVHGISFEHGEKFLRENFEIRQFSGWEICVAGGKILLRRKSHLERILSLVGIFRQKESLVREFSFGQIQWDDSLLVRDFAQIADGAKFGKDCFLGQGCFVEGNLGDGVKVGDFAFVGKDALVGRGVRLGNFCTINPGAIICSDVPANAEISGFWR